jgi:hypothetical protein
MVAWIARKLQTGGSGEWPHLEDLVACEAVKARDEYHYARWIFPLAFGLVAVIFGALSVMHPLFLIGTGVSLLIGAVLGVILHAIARTITPAQILLRKRSAMLRRRWLGLTHLLGVESGVSPRVGEVLDEAARIHLSLRPPVVGGKPLVPASRRRQDAEEAMDEAMAAMLGLAEPPSPAHQEALLDQGWAPRLLDEMRAASRAMASLPDSEEDEGHALHRLRRTRLELESVKEAHDELEEEFRS